MCPCPSLIHIQLKSSFKEVQELRNKSGFGWDDVNQLVTADEQTWKDLFSTPVGIPSVLDLAADPRVRMERNDSRNGANNPSPVTTISASFVIPSTRQGQVLFGLAKLLLSTTREKKKKGP
jgi:hypothetical protein